MFEIKETVYTTDDLVANPEINIVYQNEDLMACIQKMYELQHDMMIGYGTDYGSNLKENCGCDIELGFNGEYGIEWKIYYADSNNNPHELPNLNDLFYDYQMEKALNSHN